MTGKVDLVMWTKNGERFLPLVLKRVDEVIPHEKINQKILVDDHSADDTIKIAKDFNWSVYTNPSTGIPSGANEALRHVKTEFFVSLEQDLLLAKKWWSKIPKHLLNKKVAVSSGIRLANQPMALRKLEEYTMERYEKKNFLYPTLDNTMYETEVIRKLGGFPKLYISGGVDIVLAKTLYSKGYIWKVDYTVKSTHLRDGLRDELTHQYWYGACKRKLDPGVLNYGEVLRLLFSPIRGLDIAIKKRAPQIVCVYPLLRFYHLKGILMNT